MESSKLERLNLINQFLILKKLYPESANHYSKHRKALEEGYVLRYKWILEHIDSEMSDSECRGVLDILEMYRAITFAHLIEENAEGRGDQKYRFPGFDGNEEPEALAYATYYIVGLGRYRELNYQRDSEYPSFNSHTAASQVTPFRPTDFLRAESILS